MLVLSRKESDKILLPTLGVTFEVLRIRGNRTRIGVVAPDDVPIVREEIADLKSIDFSDEPSANQQLSKLAHSVRERLDSAGTLLNRLHKHLEGDAAAQKLVCDVFRELKSLEGDAELSLASDDKPAKSALLVEDDPNERELLASYLRLNGFTINTASDGQDALDYLSLHARPDAILLDMNMPRIDGPHLVRELRSNPDLRNIQLLAVSAAEPTSLGVATGPSGIDRWFPKPVNPEHLVEALAKYLAA